MKLNRIFFLLLSLLFVQQIVSQNLTISATGETGTTGTNWSISSNVLTISGTATIAASVIENHLASNSLSIQGNSTSFVVNISQSITSSTSGNGLTIGASSNTGKISLNNTISIAGSMTIFGGRVSIMEAFAISGSNNLSITSINTVIAGTATIGGSASISASGNFILGTNITAGTGFPFTASGGFSKTGTGTSYLFSNINTTNTAVSLAGPVIVGNYNTSNAITQINTNGGNISIPGAVSAYSGTGREYMALVYANLYDATGGAVSGSTTDIYLRFNAGSQSFIGLPGMPVSFNLQYLLVAGGGGGGGSNVGVHTGGGGGGGGVAEGNLTFNTGNILNMVVGSGGVGGGGNCCINGINGGDTGFNELGLWTGGGGGAGNAGQSAGNTGTGNNNLAVVGRSYLAGGGGGGSGRNNFVYPPGGTGTLYTQAGSGTQTSFGNWAPWGGGGGGAVSGGYFFGDLAYGGAGRSSSITGTSVVYGSGSGPRDRTSTIGSGGSSNTTDAASVNGSNGAVILRFTLSSSLDAASLSTSFHLNAIAGSVTLGSTVANLSAIEITAGIASSITGPITGTGSLLKTGTGALTLSGDNRYTGGTTVTTGTLLLNDTAPMDGMGVVVGTLNINQNGTVQLTGLVSALGYNADRVTTININGGVLEAVGGVQHIWNLTGGLNFNGGGTVKSNGGTSNAAATSYFEWGATNITVTNPTSPAEIAGRINLRSDLGGITFTVADGTAANDLLISAAITQTSAPTLTKTGVGKLTFTGVNNYTGVTTISAGILQIGDGGTNGTISEAGVTNNAALIFNRSDNFTISNVISGTGTLTKTGAGTLTLSGANTYTGLSTISQGTLKCGSATALGTVAGSTTIVNGAALDLNGINYSTAEPLTINGTGVSASGVISNSTTTAATFAGPITLASNATINGSAGDLTLSGAINGAFALNVNSTNKAYTQSGIIGGTTPPTAYTVAVGNTGSTTLSGATTVAGPVSISGGTLAINANLTATANNVSLSAVNTVTQSAPIMANGLDLNGVGTFTLTNTTNNIVTLSGGSSTSKLASVNYIDSDGFTIGMVTNTGITASGTIAAETQLGTITIAQNITTDNTTSSAITINAGKPRSIGDAIGGNIIILGSPTITTGTNGITKLYSGREAESTGLTTFVGGASNVRLGVDETTVTFAPVLANNNKYALYRYSDLIIGGITIVSSGGVTVNNGWEFVNNTIIPTSAAAINIDASVLQNYLVTNPLTLKAGSITFSSNITNTTANQLTLNSNTFIKNTNATTITSQGGNVLMASNIDDATDNDITTNGYIQFLSGLTMTTNGGNITLGGGDAAASGYALGNNVSGSYEGIRVDGTLNLNSGGGNIVMRGKSYAVNSTSARWALGFWVLTTGSINSGTGTILLDGFSQSSGSTYSSALYNNGALTITSANTTADAIRMIGKATGTSGDAWGIEANSALSVLATGDGGGITISTSQQVADNYDAVFRGETNILAKSGPIQLLGKQDGGVANGRWLVATNFYLGSKAGSTVTTSSSNITIQYDKYNFTIYPYIATSGLVTWKPGSASFGQDVFTSWFNWNQNSQTMSGLTIGKIGNTANVTHQTTAVTVAGPLTIYGGDISVSHNFNSTLSGADILLQATGAINLASSKTIQTSAGDVTLSATSGGTATSSYSAIYLNSYSQILSYGGNITLGGGYSGTEGNLYAATTILGGGLAVRMDGGTILNANGGNINIYGRNVSSYGDGVYFSSVNISTLGSGTIGIYGDSYGGFNGTTYYGGISFENNASTIQNVNGSITLKGILTQSQHAEGYAINFYRSAGVTGQTKHIQIVSQTGAIQITGDRGTSIGRGFGHSSWGNIYFGSPSDNSFTATGAIKFTYSSLVIATNNGFKVKTTGPVTYEPAAASFITAQTLPSNAFSTLADGSSSLSVGKSGNTADITMGTAQTVAGPISIYGGTITLNAGLTATNNGAISFYSDNAIAGLSSPRTVTASGAMNFIPQSASFGAAVTYPIANLNVTSTGLLIGKTTNVANVTFGNTTSINGPITVYGGTVALNENISSSANSTISLYANALTIASGKTITSGGQLIITPQNTSTTIGIAGASGTLALPLSYFSTNFTDGFSNIQIGSNTQIGNISTNAFTLRDNMTFLTSGSLTLGGKPLMGSNNVTLGSAISSFSGMPTYYFKTDGTGKVFRNLSHASSFQFPIGNSSYNPVSITNNSGSADDFSVRIVDAVYLNGTSGSVVSTPVVNRTWDISKTNVNTGAGVGLVFNWNNGEVANGSLTNPYLNHHTGSVWEIPTVASTAFGTNMFTVVGYTGTFSPFTVAEGASALPVEMVYFYTNCSEGDVKINWQTASEHNSDYFQLETSLDGVNWEIIETIPAAGFSQELLNYSFTEVNAAREQKYYRLKQVDFNGEFSLYGPLKADCAVESTNISLHPNPCESQVTLSIDTQIPAEISYTIANPEGVVLETKKMAVQSGITLYTLDVSNYPSGMYILQFKMNDKHFIKKLTVQ